MHQQMLALDHYLGILKRRKWVVITPIALGVLGVIVATLWLPQMNTRSYETAATVRLALAGRSVAGVPPITDAEAAKLTQTSAHLLKSRTSLNTIIAELGLTETPDQLQRRISVEAIPNTELLLLKARADNPVAAQRLANTLARQWPKQAEEFYLRINSPQLASSFAAIEDAPLPAAPLGLPWPKRIVLGLVMGVLAGLCLAVIFDYTDRTVNTIDDLRAVPGVNIIGSVMRPAGLDYDAAALMSLSGNYDPFDSPEARLLAVKMQRLIEERRLPSLLVTSTWPKEGATSVAISIALGLVRSGSETLLVDADLASPSIQRAFDLPARQPGLTDILASVSDSQDLGVIISRALQFSPVAGLTIITSGSVVPDSWKLLGSGEMKRLVEFFHREDYLMVIDGPPLSTADTFALASVVSGVVVVCAEGRTTIDDLQQRLNQLNSLGANVLGVVYNGVNNAFSDGAVADDAIQSVPAEH